MAPNAPKPTGPSPFTLSISGPTATIANAAEKVNAVGAMLRSREIEAITAVPILLTAHFDIMASLLDQQARTNYLLEKLVALQEAANKKPQATFNPHLLRAAQLMTDEEIDAAIARLEGNPSDAKDK